MLIEVVTGVGILDESKVVLKVPARKLRLTGVR